MQNFPNNMLDAIRGQLEAENISLATRMEELKKQDPFADPSRANDNAASDTEASELSGHDRISALIEEVKKQQEDIDAALRRIIDGTYGVCSNCHKLIPIERLRILPTAILCLDCEGKKF